MTVLDLMKKRFSARNYNDKPVDKEDILKILEAANVAPSAVNFQPWEFIVVQDKELLEQIQQVYPREWFKKAPVVIIACGDHSSAWRRADGKDHTDVDVSIAVDHMTLVATELGIGSCWVCAFDSYKLSKILKLPHNLEAIAMLPIGHTDEEGDTMRHQLRRKKLEDIVHWDGYQN